jgi:hypothetical protein
MPFQAYLPVGFAHSHESRMVEQLTTVFAASSSDWLTIRDVRSLLEGIRTGLC